MSVLCSKRDKLEISIQHDYKMQIVNKTLNVEQTININAEEWAWRKYWKGIGRRKWKDAKATGSLKPLVNYFVLTPLPLIQ